MLRILRAFAWMRWRVLINSFESTGARDTVERLSLAVEQLGPILAGLFLVPSALGIAVLSGYAGYAVAVSSEPPLTFQLLGFLLFAALAFSIVGPILLPAGERTNAVRLLLLPIPRSVLYVAQSAAALSDPWILLALPIVFALSIGLALGGALTAAAVALVAGLLFVAVLVGISSLTTTLVHLALRDRRRGELLALLFIVVFPILAMVPGFMHTPSRQADKPAQQGEAPARRVRTIPPWVQEAGARAIAFTPSELYRTSVTDARNRGAFAPVAPLAGLFMAAAGLHTLGLLAFGRVLDSPGSSGTRRGGAEARTRFLKIPGISSGASAVAQSQLRLALRTPRGRSILISPVVVFAVFAAFMRRSGDLEFGFIQLQSGLALAVFGAVVCLLSILPFAMNQFAIDRAGLTLQLLSPLSDLDILIGKAIGNGIIAGVPALMCVAIAYALFPAGPISLWISVPLGILATYLLAAPGAAVLSSLFPRAVDLNSIGNKSNAHGLAGLLGLAVFVLSGAPPGLLTMLALLLLERPGVAPVLLLIWCVVTLVIGRLLFTPVSLLFNRRRENLGLVA